MAVDDRRRTVGSPAGVGDGYLLKEDLLLVDGGLCDEFLQASDLSDVLEIDDLVLVIAVDADTYRTCEPMF